MRCPVCYSEKSKVVDSRRVSDGIFRVRKCQECARTYVTEEAVVDILRAKELSSEVYNNRMKREFVDIF